MQMILSLLVLVLFTTAGFSQADSLALVKYTPEFRFKEGVFLTFDAVKLNQPIGPERIISGEKPEQLHYYEQLFDQKSIYFFDEF